MNFTDKVEAALEEALQNENSKPLRNLLAIAIQRMGVGNADDLNEIRRDVYLGIARLHARGQPIKEMAPQVWTIVYRSRATYYRQVLKNPLSVPLEAVHSQVEKTLRSAAVSDHLSLSAEQEEKCEAVARVLLAMGNSGKPSDRKRYLAVVAAIAGEDPVEALRREFGPAITAKYAATLKHRGILQVKAEYEASKSKKAS
jgi:hypothetical protein